MYEISLQTSIPTLKMWAEKWIVMQEFHQRPQTPQGESVAKPDTTNSWYNQTQVKTILAAT